MYSFSDYVAKVNRWSTLGFQHFDRSKLLACDSVEKNKWSYWEIEEPEEGNDPKTNLSQKQGTDLP